MLAVPARLRRHRLPVRLRGHARLERHAHTYALPVAVALLLALAACGGSSSGGHDLAAVCKEQRAILASAPQPVGLRGAAEVMRRVVAMDTALRAAADDGALTARIDRVDQNARRGLAAIQNTDPDRSMFPLRTGAANGRRVLSAAQSLLNDAC